MKTHLTFLLWLTLGYIAYFVVVICLDLLSIKLRERIEKAKTQIHVPDYKPVSTKIVREGADGKVEILDAVPWHAYAFELPDQLTLIIRADLEPQLHRRPSRV